MFYGENQLILSSYPICLRIKCWFLDVFVNIQLLYKYSVRVSIGAIRIYKYRYLHFLSIQSFALCLQIYTHIQMRYYINVYCFNKDKSKQTLITNCKGTKQGKF